MLKSALRSLTQGLTLFFIFMTVNGCEGWLWDVPQSKNANQGQTIEILTISGPLSYKSNHDDVIGYEHDLLWEFAADRGYQLKFKVLPNEQAVLKALQDGQGDVAAARLPGHWATEDSTILGPAYDEQDLVLVCKKPVVVQTTLTGSFSNKNTLRVLTLRKAMGPQARTAFRRAYPKVNLYDHDQGSTMDLMRLVQKASYDCAIVDQFEARFYERFFPQLRTVLNMGGGQPYHFFVSKKDSSLSSELTYWFQRAARRGELGRIKDRYLTHLDELKQNDAQKFFKSLKTKLSLYQPHFKKYGNEFELPWQLVAAVAYQESHWNADAESHTGVKGLMQLTVQTADHLGIEDRTDPVQSIWGGSKYIRFLIDQQPKDLAFRERIALALAAYNVGSAHLRDAQVLAERLGKDPLSWKDLKTVLPLLSEPAYYETLRYGAARGQEPVDFVHRVLSYYDLLTQKI